MENKKYCPSNGTEGDWFMSKFCCNCIHDNPNYDAKSPRCDILTMTMCVSVNDKDYPKEWIYNEENKPICTAFVKWDWGNDGDPNDPNNPKAPIPEDPNQLCLPFIIDEIKLNTKNITNERIKETNY
ncbi:MAG: hypothetical protein KA347_06610 [Bacteroidia bacterium]|nr:hypothetical protein [Bacteroidia bacterium]